MCSKCEYKKYINICEDILSDWDNDWCWDTIEGIKNWVEDNEHITDAQKEAINNIRSKLK